MERETVYAYGKPQMVVIHLERLPCSEERQAFYAEMGRVLEKTPDLKGLPVVFMHGGTRIEIVSLKPEPVGEPAQRKRSPIQKRPTGKRWTA